MDPAWQQEPLSMRVKAALSYEDEALIRDIRRMERAASGEVTSVVRNGQFPRWSPERYLLIGNAVLVTLLWVFGAGGQWTTIQKDIAEVKLSIHSLSVGLTTENEARQRIEDRLDRLIAIEPNAQMPRTGIVR